MPADSESETPSELIDATIEELHAWRGEILSRIRGLTKQAAPEVVEDIKWRKPSNPLGVPVWSHDGIILTGEIYKDKVKLTFAKGASLEDPAGLFNSTLGGKERRAIDLHEGDGIDDEAFKALVRSQALHGGDRLVAVSVGAAIAFGAVIGLALGILVSVTTDIPLAPEIGVAVGALLGWLSRREGT